MMRAVLAVILVLFIGISVFPQEVIKEKVEITPKHKNKVQGGLSHTISATLTWDLPQVQGIVALYTCGNWITDGNNWQTGGSNSATADNVPAGTIIVRYYVNVSCTDISHGELKVYIDGSLTYDFTSVFDGQYLCWTYSPFDFQFNTPYYSDFTLTSDNQLCSNSTSDPFIITPYYTDCSIPSVFDSTDIITLSITSGSEYVSLIKNSDINTASNAQTFTLSENPYITLWQNKPITGSEPIYATIDANVNGIDHQSTVHILPPQFDIGRKSAYSRNYTVPGDISPIYINARDVNFCPSVFPDSTKFNLVITSGSNYGGLVDPVTGQISSELTGLSHSQGSLQVYFNANGDIPLQEEYIKVQISTTDLSIQPRTITIPIEPATLKSTFQTSFLNPGDTTKVHIKELLSNGKTKEIPGQLFDVSIIQGNGSVFLVDPFSNQLTNSLTEVPNDFYIVAADSISTDSILVKLYIETYGGGGIAGAIKDTGNGVPKHFVKEKTVTSIIPGKNNKAKNPILKTDNNPIEKTNVTESNINLSTSSGKIKKVNEYYGDLSGVVSSWLLKPELEIKYPPNNKDEKISGAKMPSVTCEARLINYKDGPVRFEWEYGISYRLKRKMDEKGKIPLCPRTGSIVFKGTTYANNSDVTKWNVQFTKHNTKYISLIGEKYLNPNYCTDKTSEWSEGDNVFIGGDTVFVGVLAYDVNGNIIEQNSIISGKFLGVNPSKSDIKAYNSKREIWAIIKKESSWLQFAVKSTSDGIYNVPGMPTYGYPDGFGLMQLDNGPYASETDLWNWKSNIDDGAKRFDLAKIKSQNFLKKIYQDVPFDKLLVNAFQNYNGGNYYIAYDSETNVWIPTPGKDKTSYGYKVYMIYLDPNL